MSGKNVDKGEAGAAEVRITVAECTEFHSLGEYYEDIETAEEAAAIYRQIPPGRRNGIPSIGICFHIPGQPEREDIQLDILTGSVIDTEMLCYVPEMEKSPQVWEAVRALKRLFPEKEAVDN